MGTSKTEYIDISWEEKNSGKYQSVSIIGDKCQARVLMVDGEIDPDQSYSTQYCQKHKLGRFAESSNSASKKSTTVLPFSKKEKKEKSTSQTQNNPISYTQSMNRSYMQRSSEDESEENLRWKRSLIEDLTMLSQMEDLNYEIAKLAETGLDKTETMKTLNKLFREAALIWDGNSRLDGFETKREIFEIFNAIPLPSDKEQLKIYCSILKSLKDADNKQFVRRVRSKSENIVTENIFVPFVRRVREHVKSLGLNKDKEFSNLQKITW